MKSRDKLLDALGKRIKDLRGREDMTQEELAEKSHLDPTYISGIERGVRNPTVLILGRVARAFNLSISRLMEGVGN